VATTFWEPAQTAVLSAAIDSARSSRPTLMIVEGAPGSGKTSLLDELLMRARGFEVRWATGLESDDVPSAYDILAQLRIVVRPRADGALVNPFAAAQHLRTAVDEMMSGVAPVLLGLDDVQWADPESIEAVRRLLARAQGDPLLVVAASRLTSHGSSSSGVGHLRGSTAATIELRLQGLSERAAEVVVARHRPGLASAAARRLWRHTDGNPLYLTTLLSESGKTSCPRRNLPAPTAFADVIARRTERLDRSARSVLQAVCVLGSGWHSVVDVGVVASVDDVSNALEPLIDEELVETRGEGVLKLRSAHPLVRAAVYQQTALHVRRGLHARAARRVTAAESLDHRLAAVELRDDELAVDVESWAADLHVCRDYRQAAHYYRAARDVSGPRLGERAWLESLWDGVLGQNRDTGLDDTSRRPQRAAVDPVETKQRLAHLARVELGERDDAPASPTLAAIKWVSGCRLTGR
jgi:hypothetical protein